MARECGLPRTKIFMARLDRATQQPRVRAANEHFIAWVARFRGP
jgi:hypothetical protein